MKRLFIIALIILVASVLLVAAIEYDPGYILISLGQYTLETSFWIGLIVVALLLGALYFTSRFIRRSIAGSTALGQWMLGRDYRRSQQQTTKGLIAFIEGNWQTSLRILSRAAEKSETPLLNYLVAARASHAMGDAVQQKALLKKAEESTTGAAIAVGLTQAELQLRSGHLEQSLATLMRVRRNAGKHPYVLYLLKAVYEGLNDWNEVLELLPQLKKYKVLKPEELASLELSASKNSLDEAAKINGDRLAELRKLWQSFSKVVRKDSDCVACYTGYIIQLGGDTEAEKLIRDQLKKDWNKQLVSLYGSVAGEDVGKQLIHAENWLKERNNDANLLLCLGRLSLRNELWGKARVYFESSYKLENTGEVCAELGRLLACLGEHEKSNEYFHSGLLLATRELPQLPLPKKS